ncbi:MAG: WbqC family protein [Micavibrio sp.]|nr:WbqC family protein [Micavibrio sp.]
MTIIAINQPYFSPYAGYFALIRAVDIFVLFDCVQFPRRGRVHRSQIHDSESFKAGWLTLPLEQMPQDTAIKDLRMKPLKVADFSAQDQKLLQETAGQDFIEGDCAFVDFLGAHHDMACKDLGIETKIIRSSSLQIAPELKGQDRLIKICEVLGADHYVNLPGGKKLYEPVHFQKSGIELEFLNTDACARMGYLQAKAEGRLDLFCNQSQIIAFD